MKSRNGSALLVVLGMLAFMVVSGLAFSAFMRTTRLSSSFTRRAVTTRQLAKAALAEAIDQIDRAIANDPHPNVRLTGSNDNNYWVGRVLMGSYASNGVKTTPRDFASSLESDPASAGCDSTVPVLSLEALAYLPPCLVNEARYYGRKTATASWQSFSFDAGRYAFVALDVSDYFDVNRVSADVGRSSSPAARVTLNHLFDNAAHTQWQGGADGWDTFMDAYRTERDDGTFEFGSKIPLVSLADFNLALGTKSFGGMTSPFTKYIASGSADFYSGAEPGDGVFEKYAQMTFVTDSLDAPRAEDEQKTDGTEKWDILDLDSDNNQIFTEAFLDAPQEDRSLLTVSQLRTEPFNRLVQQRVPYVTMFNLSDYLDCDRIPLSLGIPSVERVPMICGIKPILGAAKANVSVLTNPDNNGQDQEIQGSKAALDPVVRMRRNVRWRLDGQKLAKAFMGASVDTLVVYPFLNHERVSESGWFKLDGKVQLFLSSEAMRLRTGNDADLLHWGASGSATSGGAAKLMDQAVMNLPIPAESITLSAHPTDPSECVKLQSLQLSSVASDVETALQGEKGDLLDVTYEWDMKLVDKKTGKYEPVIALSDLPDAQYVTKASSALRPLKRDGTVDTDFSSDMAKTVAKLDKTLRLNFVVTLRVTSTAGEVLGEGSSGTKTVDMVPATICDDSLLNGVDNGDQAVQIVYRSVSGDPTPLMKFDTGVSFPCKLDLAATCDADVKLTLDGSRAASVMVDDPRWNHAPENWKVLDSFSAQGWYAAQTSAANDGDIFMATADQDYQQSVYEFAFLPRLSNLVKAADGSGGFMTGYPEADSSWERLCQANPIDANLMWKTYDVFGRYSDDGDDFEGLGLENRGRGLRVNPYSDSTNVLMAAFANTPHDWRAASENEDENAGAGTSASSFNAKYAWNEYSSGAKLGWEDLQLVAGAFKDRVRSGGNWQDALFDLFDQARDKDTDQYLCGIQLENPSDKVYSVDKKFLYGYWRNCFAARQQLFLVFFRAEPMMLGGGVAGVTPPQLGAKGVAVVWRNPDRTSGLDNTNNSGSGYVPHQTRVLFYRQFE